MNAAPGPPAHEVPVAEARAGARGRDRAAVRRRASRWPRSATWRSPGPGGDIPSASSSPRPRTASSPTSTAAAGSWARSTATTRRCARLANAAGAIVAPIDYRLVARAPLPGRARRLPGGDPLARRRSSRATWLARRPATAPAATSRRSCALRLRGELAAAAAGADLPGDRRRGSTGRRSASSASGYGLSAAQLRRVWNDYLDGADGGAPGRVAAARDRSRGRRAGVRPHRRGRRPARRGRGLRGRAARRRRAGRARALAGHDPRLLALAGG